MTMLDEKDFQKQKIKPETWKTIFSFAGKYKKAYAKVLGGGMLIGVLDLVMNFVSMWAIDSFMAPGTTARLPLFITVVVVIQALICAGVLLIDLIVWGRRQMLKAPCRQKKRQLNFYTKSTFFLSFF